MAALDVMDEPRGDAGERVKLPVQAGLHALFALAKQAGFAGEALVALPPDARLTGRVTRLAFLRGFVFEVARGAFRHTGAICTSRQTRLT